MLTIVLDPGHGGPSNPPPPAGRSPVGPVALFQLEPPTFAPRAQRFGRRRCCSGHRVRCRHPGRTRGHAGRSDGRRGPARPRDRLDPDRRQRGHPSAEGRRREGGQGRLIQTNSEVYGASVKMSVMKEVFGLNWRTNGKRLDVLVEVSFAASRRMLRVPLVDLGPGENIPAELHLTLGLRPISSHPGPGPRGLSLSDAGLSLRRISYQCHKKMFQQRGDFSCPPTTRNCAKPS